MDYTTYYNGDYVFKKERFLSKNLSNNSRESDADADARMKHNMAIAAGQYYLKYSDKVLDNQFVTEPMDDFLQRHNIDPIYKQYVDEILCMTQIHDHWYPEVAGGYWRRALEGEKFSEFSGDVDLFCHEYNAQFYLLKNYLADTYSPVDIKGNPYRVDIEGLTVANMMEERKNKNLFSSDVLGQVTLNHRAGKTIPVTELGHTKKVQLVHEYFSLRNDNICTTGGGKRLYLFLLSFDNYNSMITYNYGSNTVTYHVETISSIMNNKYNFNLLNNSHPLLLTKRVIKFSSYGWEFDDETLKEIMMWNYFNHGRIDNEVVYHQGS